MTQPIPLLKDAPNGDRASTQAIAQLRKQYGTGALMRLGDHATAIPFDAIPTGALTLDLALGIGGIPRARGVEIYGPDASRKGLPADAHVATTSTSPTIPAVLGDFAVARRPTSLRRTPMAMIQRTLRYYAHVS